ncbi:MAG: DUF2157 domain-containing protein [Bacteroidota bacterium]
MSLRKDLRELREAEVISAETEERIQQYYQQKSEESGSRLFVVFGILGAILIGLGIILIIAHNWDDLSRPAKTIFAFLPLLIGQSVGIFTLLKRHDYAVWREGSAVFLFFAVGGSISLVSQIYNIPGNLSSFLVTWMLLVLPLVYLLRSSVTSLLYIIGSTYYAVQMSYWSHITPPAYNYWLLLLLIIPYYYRLYRVHPDSNYTYFHHLFLPLSVVICLGSLADGYGILLFVAYMSLFGLYYLMGNYWFKGQKNDRNAYTVIGSLGTVIVLLILSYDSIWEEMRQEILPFIKLLSAPEFWAAVVLSIVAGGLLLRSTRKHAISKLQPVAPVFAVFILIYIIGLYSAVAVILVNVLILLVGLAITRKGARQDHLGILNYGLLVIAALVLCRFFDERLSFILRGTLFVLVGIGFFFANYQILKKRKAHVE